MPSKEPQVTRQTLEIFCALLHCPLDIGLSGAQLAQIAKIHTGTLYPLLHRLEDARWLVSEWETESPKSLGRPRRRFYRLTPGGKRKAQEAVKTMQRWVDVGSNAKGGTALGSRLSF